MQSKHLQTVAHALVLVSIMLGLIAAGIWLKGAPLVAKAEAQTRLSGAQARGDPGPGIPDQGKQLQQMVDQLETMNRRLADLEKGFRDGSFVVQTVEPKGAQKASAKSE